MRTRNILHSENDCVQENWKLACF